MMSLHSFLNDSLPENAHAPALCAFPSSVTPNLFVNSGTRTRMRVPWEGRVPQVPLLYLGVLRVAAP
jgi:hypothetical protein